MIENKLYMLDNPIPDQPVPTHRVTYNTWLKPVDDSIEVSSLMLVTKDTGPSKGYGASYNI